MAACGGFFSEENIIVLEAPSNLCAVQYAEGRYPPGRLLILSDNHAQVLALCKGRSKHFYAAFSHASNLCGFGTGFVLSFRWIPSELNYSEKGGRFLDRDYDLSKSLLNALAQRIARSSPSLTKQRISFFLAFALGCGCS